MSARVLLERQAELLAAIERGQVPTWARAHLVALVRHALDTHEARARAAALASLRRSERIKAGILLALAVLPPDERGVACVVLRRITRYGPAAYGLATVPDIRTIRKAIATRRGIPDRDARNAEARRGHTAAVTLTREELVCPT